jgi:hypothetical protein
LLKTLNGFLSQYMANVAQWSAAELKCGKFATLGLIQKVPNPNSPSTARHFLEQLVFGDFRRYPWVRFELKLHPPPK